MIDPVNLPACMQRVPMRSFVGMQDRGTANDTLGNLYAFAFVLPHERPGAALALAQRDNDTALAGLVWSGLGAAQFGASAT
jgi:hypothetical protein